MNRNPRKQYYIFFSRATLPQENRAGFIREVHSANAAANLGYPTVLVYLSRGRNAYNPLNWIHPFQPKIPSNALIEFYHIQNRLKAIPLSLPWPIDKIGGKYTAATTVVCRYYFPVYFFPVTAILHVSDWAMVEAAVKHKTPVIYEQTHYKHQRFASHIVNSRFFQAAVTVSEPVRKNMIKNGMPPDKLVKLHLGLNRAFLKRDPDGSAEWRQRLLEPGRRYLVVYAGALFRFKGIDLLLEVAKACPHIQFVFAGGDASQVKAYGIMAQEMRVGNVKFLGYVPHNRLAGLLQAADALAHPHCSGEASTFTSPLKFLDYMASGTPIAATEIPPLMEFKSTEVAAGWCRPDDPIQFTRCLEQVLATYPRKLAGYGASPEFLDRYSWENRITRIMSRIEEPLLSGLNQ